jgi:hypothetical protein
MQLIQFKSRMSQNDFYCDYKFNMNYFQVNKILKVEFWSDSDNFENRLIKLTS